MTNALKDVMAACMFEEDAQRGKFDKACKKPDKGELAAWSKLYGWAPPAELAQWQACLPGYKKLFYEISDVWALREVVLYGRKAAADALVNDSGGMMTLTTGLYHFGDDPSGDSAWLSTLPNPDDTAEVHVFDHETAELGGPYPSIASFVRAKWSDADVKRRASKTGGVALYERMKWMWSFGSGEPGYHFAEEMAKAPGFDVWTKEKKAAGKTPHLANYWLLAHYFLGNTEACREAIVIAAKAPGKITPALAKIVKALLDEPKKAKLGKVKPSTLAELRAAVAKNAEEKLLEPTVRAAVATARAGDTVKADVGGIKKRLAAGEDVWAIIAEFPDDVATHDLALAALAKRDATFKPTLERYQEQRAEEDIYDEWPREWDEKGRAGFDRRLSPAIGAAFRAGLTYDADNKRASSSLVNTLAFLDDDVAMQSFEAAIDKCRMDDDRLEYVVKALRASKHPRAQEVLARAAWKFFEFFDATKKSMTKTAKEGPTLDNMFRVHSHLLVALVVRIRTGDDESEKLADKVLSILENMRVLGVAYSAAFALVAERKLERHAKLAEAYCKLAFAMQGERLSNETFYNLSEAALAFATLRPAEAETALRAELGGMSAEAPRVESIRLDKIACALAGLLALHPGDAELVAWAERILGNRSGNERVYGALRGVAAGKVAAAKPWIPWHVYHGCSSNHIGEKPGIMRAARAALIALGEPEPRLFDETDEFANKRTDEQLPDALRDRSRYLLDWTFKRVVERGLRSPEVVRASGEVLADHYRFSADEDSHGNDRDRTEGLACMIHQGAPALPALAGLLQLPFMAGADKTVVITVMSVISDAPSFLARMATATQAEVIAALAPTAENIGNLDLAAGWALAHVGVPAHEAIEAAFKWRFDMIEIGSDHWIDGDPIANGLARAIAQLPHGKPLLAQYAQLENHHIGQVIEGAQNFKPAPVTGNVFIAQTREYGGPKYTVTVADGALALACEDIHCQGIVKESKYTQRAPFDAAYTDKLGAALAAIGFVSPAAPKDKKKKR